MAKHFPRQRHLEVLAQQIARVHPQKAQGLVQFGPDEYESAALDAMEIVAPRWWDVKGPWPVVFIVGAAVGAFIHSLF